MPEEIPPTPSGGDPEELRPRAREERDQARRLERLGRLAASAAHQYNNVLTVILSCGQALAVAAERGLPTPSEEVQELLQAAERAKVLTRRLLALARRERPEPVPLDLTTARAIAWRRDGRMGAEPRRSAPAEVRRARTEAVSAADQDVSSPRRPAPTRAPSAQPPGGAETILLVEDDAAVRRQALRALAGAGYQVHVAADADEAMAIAPALPRAPDLLLTDGRMPRVDGPRLAERLRSRWPALRVVLTGRDPGECLEPGGRELPEKPFTIAGLLSRVREALDAAPPEERCERSS